MAEERQAMEGAAEDLAEVDGVLPFAGASGQGIRVAVIDSGVNPRHPHIAHVAGGAAVAIGDEIESGEDAFLDRLGHGTAVMAAIQEKAPDAEYFALRVFHTSLRTTASALIRAIDWCIEQKMDVVNLSLGSPNRAHALSFTQAAERASEKGALVVAAREASGELCYPGCLPAVFSVGLDWDCPRNRYRYEQIGDETVFYASGYPRPAPGVPRARNLYGISFAVANMTAFIVRACEMESGRGQLRERSALIKNALVRAVTLENDAQST